jgi:hypothetical protein
MPAARTDWTGARAMWYFIVAVAAVFLFFLWAINGEPR